MVHNQLELPSDSADTTARSSTLAKRKKTIKTHIETAIAEAVWITAASFCCLCLKDGTLNSVIVFSDVKMCM